MGYFIICCFEPLYFVFFVSNLTCSFHTLHFALPLLTTHKQLSKTLSLFSVKYNDSIKNDMNYSLEFFWPINTKTILQLPLLLRVCVHGLCVCVFTAVCVHFGWFKCRAQIPSMGHHTWPHVMSLHE